jgi:hypothetical protein
MTSTGFRIYTTIIALICGAAVAWSIHQASLASSWQADARSWHALAQRTVLHDRATSSDMRHLVRRYNRLVIQTRRSERKLLAGIRRGQASTAALPSASFASAPSPVSSPVASPAPSAPSTHTS